MSNSTNLTPQFKSQLPGGIGKAVNSRLGGEEIIFELNTFAGQALIITQTRVFLIKVNIFKQSVKIFQRNSISTYQIDTPVMNPPYLQITAPGTPEVTLPLSIGITISTKFYDSENVIRISSRHLAELRIEMSKVFQSQAKNPHSSDLVNNLEKLTNLRDSGAISADEFAAAKQKLLG
jgi:Short C-terminal domain